YVMASQWGSNTLSAGESANWFFLRPKNIGFLPVLSVVPLTPSFMGSEAHVDWKDGDAFFPWFNQLGISTIWSQLSDDSSSLVYYLTVYNVSDSTIEYAFLEADL
ncbi:MAG: hypothetical protein ACREE9_12940, partial [Stellaceae bacterium]